MPPRRAPIRAPKGQRKAPVGKRGPPPATYIGQTVTVMGRKYRVGVKGTWVAVKKRPATRVAAKRPAAKRVVKKGSSKYIGGVRVGARRTHNGVIQSFRSSGVWRKVGSPVGGAKKKKVAARAPRGFHLRDYDGPLNSRMFRAVTVNKGYSDYVPQFTGAKFETLPAKTYATAWDTTNWVDDKGSKLERPKYGIPYMAEKPHDASDWRYLEGTDTIKADLIPRVLGVAVPMVADRRNIDLF